MPNYVKRLAQLVHEHPLFQYLNYVAQALTVKQGVRLFYMAEAVNTTFEEYISVGRQTVLINCQVGSFTYFGPRCRFNNTTIGRFCSVASDIKCGLGQHPINAVSTHPIFYKYTARPVSITLAERDLHEEFKSIAIGHDVWIGENVTIMDGATVGNGAVLAAGSVITKDVAPYTIVGGVPAVAIRKRFTEEQIVFLEELQWWNKDLAWLRSHKHLWHDVDALQRSIY